MMDEMKNENVTEEPVIEQRPSTKYGRTAYQQQLQEDQAAQGQQTPPQEQQNGYRYWEGGQNPYQQNQNYYNQTQYNTYSTYQEPKPEVKNTYAYILMALVGATGIISAIINVLLSEAYSMGNTIEEVMDAIFVIVEQPGISVLSSINSFLNWTIIALLVIDIIQLHKAGKKITGAILFAIFLRPAYFIWRAHLLGQKKVGAIIFTIVFYLVSFVQASILMTACMDMAMRITLETGVY